MGESEADCEENGFSRYGIFKSEADCEEKESI